MMYSEDIIKLADILNTNNVKVNNLTISYDINEAEFEKLNDDLGKKFMGIKENAADEIKVHVMGINFLFKKKKEPLAEQPKKKWF